MDSLPERLVRCRGRCQLLVGLGRQGRELATQRRVVRAFGGWGFDVRKKHIGNFDDKAVVSQLAQVV